MMSPQGQHKDKGPFLTLFKIKPILVSQGQHSLEPLNGVQKNLMLLEETSV
jgi:hypothetical protein